MGRTKRNKKVKKSTRPVGRPPKKHPKKLVISKENKVVEINPLTDDELDELDHPKFVEDLENGMFEGVVPRKTKRGMRIKFRNHFTRQVYYLVKFGLNDEMLADFFKVSLDMINSWKKNNPDFIRAYEQGKWISSIKCSETLYQAAMGYDYCETEYSQTVTRQGDVVNLKKVTHKHMPPNVSALFFILKNRHKELWSDTNKTEIEAKFNVGMSKNLDYSILDDDQKELLKGVLIKQVSAIQGQSE